MWNAIKVITNPRLDEYEMNDEEKESIRRALSKNPKNSLANSEWMLRAVKSVREITNDTKAEIYEVAAEPGVNYIKRLGLDMVEGVADDVDKVAATTACVLWNEPIAMERQASASLSVVPYILFVKRTSAMD